MQESVSFVVSSRGRPKELAVCLASLALQEDPKEVWVAGTIEDEPVRPRIRELCGEFGAVYVQESNPGHIFFATDLVVPMTTGEWLAFPNDDCYLVPGYSKVMLEAAAENGWDLVYCDVLYDPRIVGWYAPIISEPVACRIDKICYLVRRSVFPPDGFPCKEHVMFWIMSDSLLIHKLVQWQKVKSGKAKGVLAFHN